MTALVHSPLFGLLLTLASYRLGQCIYSRSHGFPLLHPFLLATLPVVSLLLWVDLSYDEYLLQTSILQFLLGPATVALAWPLYRQLHTIQHVWKPVLLATVIGGSLAALVSVLTAWWLGAPAEVTGAMATKSITTPIAIDLSRITGGHISLAAGIVAITGVVGAMTAPLFFRWLRIEDDRVRGFTLGVVAHAIGTARAFEYSEKAGAFSGLALGLTGLFTALTLPWVWPWLVQLLHG